MAETQISLVKLFSQSDRVEVEPAWLTINFQKRDKSASQTGLRLRLRLRLSWNIGRMEEWNVGMMED
jgi:hypothetical protein